MRSNPVARPARDPVEALLRRMLSTATKSSLGPAYKHQSSRQTPQGRAVDFSLVHQQSSVEAVGHTGTRTAVAIVALAEGSGLLWVSLFSAG